MPPTPESEVSQGHPFQPDSREKREWILELLFGNAGPSSQANLYKVYVPVSLSEYPDKMLPVTFGTKKNKNSAFVRHPRCEAGSETIGASPLEAGSETPEQQQDSSPCQAKRSPTKCFPLLLEPIKNSSFVRHPRCEAGSQTIGARPLEAEIRQNA